MAILFVDKKAKNDIGEIAILSDREAVLLNLSLISKDYLEKFQKAAETMKEGALNFCLCGRYIVLIQLSEEKGEMTFIDTGNNIDEALRAYSILGKHNRELKNTFMNLFNELKEIYDEVYESVELRLLSELKSGGFKP